MKEDDHQNELLQFKEFINNHPKLIREIRKNGKSWQELYEQWVLLGEDDIHWNQYKDDIEDKEAENQDKDGIFSKLDLKPDLVKQVLKYAETIDINKLQEQVQQLSKTIGTVQEIVNQYQQPKRTGNQKDRPFDWFTD
ncbi:YlbD family protein [Oceanobacillus luteolus]|uniref:YlbD family protein n=1 Tax=Oceanobacillus luteolus TaxID=1274358 RepID=A0ABW4HSA0_9BACI|nr:YlbD family protein [Oceanobacillus luteolus]MCM3742252.1 YlbD family protein [Oceanobacillus luteolus]